MRFRTAVTAGEVAGLVGGEVRGPPDRRLAGFAALTQAGPGELAFATGAEVERKLQGTQAGAVLVSPALFSAVPANTIAILVAAPVTAAERVCSAFGAEHRDARWGIDASARIGRGCRWEGRIRIDAGVRIGPDVRFGQDCVVETGASIEEGARLGDRCRVGHQATIHRGVRLGHRVQIRPGARIGGPGFGFVHEAGRHARVPQFAGCVLDDDVEVGANSTIDRGATRDTQIGAGTKIDNLVQIAHNVRVGRGCIIMAQVGIAGSTVVEDVVMLAGQAGLADHLTVGRGSRVGAQSGVIGDVPPEATVSGYPARDHRSVLRQVAALQRLTPIVSSLERTVKSDEH